MNVHVDQNKTNTDPEVKSEQDRREKKLGIKLVTGVVLLWVMSWIAIDLAIPATIKSGNSNGICEQYFSELYSFFLAETPT